jgi:membrane protease YdiL (CAAX protease family)
MQAGVQDASSYGVAFGWCAAATFLATGALSLRLFDFRPHQAREPVWLTDTRLPLAVSLLLAAGEEVLFRGVLQSISLSFGPPLYPLFAVNVLFAAIHFRGGLTFAMSAGFFGMLASIMTLASASLMPAIFMHVGWNLLVAVARGRESARAAAVGGGPDQPRRSDPLD